MDRVAGVESQRRGQRVGVADRRRVALVGIRPLEHLLESLVETSLLDPTPCATLPLQHVHGDGPSLSEFTDDPFLRDVRAVEEDLREMVLAVLRPDRADVGALLIEVDEDHREALVARTARSGEQDGTARQVAERRPDLLAVQAVAVAVRFHTGAERRQVAAGVRLGECLCPGVVAAQQTWQQLVGQMRCEDQQHGHEDLERRERLGDLDVCIPQRLEHGRSKSRIATEPAGRFGPTEP